MTELPLAPAYREAIKLALVMQVLLTLVLLALLDGGAMAKVGGGALAVFWFGAAVVMIRRPRDPGSFDLLYVRWGFLAVWLVGMACAMLLGGLRL